MKDADTANAIIKLIGQGKIPHLKWLDFSQVSDPQKINFDLLTENLDCVPNFESINLNGISTASAFIEKSDPGSSVKRLRLNKCQLTPDAYAAIPVKFTQLKELYLSNVNEFKDVGQFINHLNNPIELEILDLSNSNSWDRQTLLDLGDKLVWFICQNYNRLI